MNRTAPAAAPALVKASSRLARLLLAASLAAAASSAWSAIDLGDTGTGDGEFLLVVWDPIKEASYALDLGYRMETLLVDGQKDAGFQRFWKVDGSTDPQFKKLLDLGTAASDLRWGVFAADVINSFGIIGIAFDPADLRVFTTLEHTVATGTVNPFYASMLGQTNEQLISAANAYSGYMATLNSESGNANNTHGTNGPTEFGFNGSSYHLKGQGGYFDTGFQPSFIQNGGPSITNAVGSSSWAYQVMNSDTSLGADVTVDEFDNLTHDGFWGLAVDTDGSFALSFTIEGTGLTLAQRTFVQAIGRTELNGGFNTKRLSGAAASPMEAGNGFSRRLLDANDQLAVSVVPEPSSWLLMSLGLGFMGWFARRRH